MTLHFSDTKSFSRKQNKSAVASIAYRSGTKLHDERNDKTHNYSGKSKYVTSADIILPSAFNGENIAIDRGTIWNNAERAEKRKDARVAREWLINLPHHLDEQTRKELAHSFAQKLADRYNVIADCCIHKPSDKEIKKGADPRNFHAHIMLTTREIDVQNGEIVFTKKAVSELSDSDRRKLGLSRMSDEMIAIKQLWDDTANPVLRQHGLPEMDYRSHKEKGDDLLPQVKMGVSATALERKGKRTKLGDINRQITQHNEIIFESRRQHERETDSFIEESNQHITYRKRVFDERKFNAKFIADRVKLNARERATRLSLADTNERAITDTDKFIENTNYEIQSADSTYRILKHQLNEQQLEQEKLAQLERERQQRERDLSVARLQRSLPLTKNERGYDFEHSNIVFDEFLKHHEPIPSEQYQHRMHLKGRDGKRLGRAVAVYDCGLIGISHYEATAQAIQSKTKFFDTSEIASFNESTNQLVFKNLGVSLDVEPAVAHWVKSSMRASEQFNHKPPQPPATAKPTLEETIEPTMPTPKPRF